MTLKNGTLILIATRKGITVILITINPHCPSSSFLTEELRLISMACSSATHMSSLPWTSSMKLLPHSFVRPNCTRSFCSYSRSRTSSCLSLSASLNSTLQSDVEINNTCSTLRELCEGHVPDHVLRRQAILVFGFGFDGEMESLGISKCYRVHIELTFDWSGVKKM